MLCLLVRLPAIHGSNSILLAIERRWAWLIASFYTHFMRIALPGRFSAGSTGCKHVYFLSAGGFKCENACIFRARTASGKHRIEQQEQLKVSKCSTPAFANPKDLAVSLWEMRQILWPVGLADCSFLCGFIVFFPCNFAS